MRRILAFIVTTVDGYYVGKNGEFGWPVVDAEFEEFAVRQLDEGDALLFGRTTYEGMAAYWPSPEASADNDQRITDRMNGYPKLVVSRSLERAEWGDTRIVRDVADLAAVKAEPGGDVLLFGSPNLAAAVLTAGLLDELRIMVAPVVLGSGLSLFAGDLGRTRLTLLRTKTFDSGNVLNTYAP